MLPSGPTVIPWGLVPAGRLYVARTEPAPAVERWPIEGVVPFSVTQSEPSGAEVTP